MPHPSDRRERSERESRVTQARRERLEPLLRRRAARTQLRRVAPRDPQRWPTSR